MTWFFEKCIQFSLRYGFFFVTSDLSGVMLILSPGYTKLTQFAYIKNGFLLLPFIMGLKNYAKFDKYEKFASKIQESVLNERDCYYIFGLATDPKKQGKGIGSTLINFLIEKADAEKIPIYLRTETKDNARYYEKFGFKVLYNSPAPTSDFDIWCMLRDV
jgi:ribosomal protein S18 acetylase RimI-like enzyme